MKRHKIVGDHLKKYQVTENIGDLLDRLSFQQRATQLPDWKLHTKTNGDKEFVGIYNCNEFLVHGRYSKIEIPQRDLETMTKYRLEENWISKEIRDRSMRFPLYLCVGALGIVALKPEVSELVAVTLAAGILIVYPVGVGISGAILNRYAGSKLSKEAEQYNYGRRAEERLRLENTFNRILANEIGKKNFLKLNGYEI
ncbi:MAG: hypothetical protein KAK00_08335 [Nanoarchaeota archaeon]|nr:hypothetical protein [Nanoarchaeota archaeon]